MAVKDEARNLAPRRGAGAFWSYLGSVTAVGGALVGWELSGLTLHGFRLMGGGFIVLAILLVLGELRPLMTAGSPDSNGVSTSTAFVFALQIHWGLGVAVLMQTIAVLIADRTRRKVPWRTAFNVAQYGLSFAAAAVVLAGFGHDPTPTHPLAITSGELPGIVAAGVTFFLVNNLLVSGAVALHDHTRLRDQFFVGWGYQVFSTGALLGLAPIVVVVMERGLILVPLLLLPLFAVYATAEMSLDKERQSLQDPLTGLPNRKHLVQSVRSRIEAARGTDANVGLFLLDLDRFKEINDTLGHQAGDALLRLVGQRLAAVVRPADVVARLGGDEFAVVVTDVGHVEHSVEIAERVRGALAQPFRHDGMSFEIDASIGVAIHPHHGWDFESLLRRADVAMYVAKERSTGVEVYSAETDHNTANRLAMLAELRGALEAHEFELHYQPKADLRTGDVVGLEALLRWRHPRRGTMSPEHFVPLAEQTGLIRALTQFVVDDALRQAAVWWGQGLEVQVAVNVCARDLYDRDFAPFLRQRLDQRGVPPQALMIEVTESVLMADPGRAATTLLSLAEIGVGVSLDDFGTGYSSLVHLKRLPVSEIKIDRSFVSRMDVEDDDAAIVRSIIDLASALGLRTVAEGVESQETWDRLAVFGCDAAQGWYLSKALPADEVAPWLRDLARSQSGAPSHVQQRPAQARRALA
jgi:diguanylate cyclase (GGDEF)-like protein